MKGDKHMNSIVKSFYVVVIIMMMLLIGFRPATAAMPEGSYKKSCRNCSDDGKTLSCQCKMKNGNYKETKLVFDYCNKGSISNDNGNLTCTAAWPKAKTKTSSSGIAKKVAEASKKP